MPLPDTLPAARPALRIVPEPALRVVDVALFYGERSGGIRTYLDSKAAWARAAGPARVEHHVIVPGPVERHRDGRHELPSLRLYVTNGYRLPAGARALKDTLRAIRPDVVLLHDPFWGALGVVDLLRDELEAVVVAVHHGSSQLDAAGLPGPDGLWRPLVRGWLHHAYRHVDAVMSVVDPLADCGRVAALPLRFGVAEAFAPQPEVVAADHVLYAGRLAREKGIDTLVEAAALAPEPWPLRIMGSGPHLPSLRARVRRLRLEDRVTFRPFEADRAALARAYAEASVVVMPGGHETFGLVALEAAACGTRVVAAVSAPSGSVVGALAHRFTAHDAADLADAITAARATPRDVPAAARLAARCSWAGAIEAELDDLRHLVRSRRRRLRR